MRKYLWVILLIILTLPIGYYTNKAYQDKPKSDEFYIWLSKSDNKNNFNEFEDFLKSNNVYGIFPTRDILQSDTQYRSDKCPIEKYNIPPKEKWKNSVETIKFVNQRIIPEFGKLKIISGYRPTAFNNCIGGASKSAHLSFSAFDFVPLNPKTIEEDFEVLCRIWKRTPATYKFGLGVYYNENKNSNSNERFHIDTIGRRTWGYDFHSKSSYCLKD